MKPILTVVATVAAMACATLAMAGPMDGAYGNTVVVDYGNNAVAKIFVNADGSYGLTQPDGVTAKGTWAVSGGQTCFTQTDPAPAAGATPSCSATVDGKGPGDSWTSTGQGGAPVKVSIVAGR